MCDCYNYNAETGSLPKYDQGVVIPSPNFCVSSWRTALWRLICQFEQGTSNAESGRRFGRCILHALAGNTHGTLSRSVGKLGKVVGMTIHAYFRAASRSPKGNYRLTDRIQCVIVRQTAVKVFTLLAAEDQFVSFSKPNASILVPGKIC